MLIVLLVPFGRRNTHVLPSDAEDQWFGASEEGLLGGVDCGGQNQNPSSAQKKKRGEKTEQKIGPRFKWMKDPSVLKVPKRKRGREMPGRKH